jgi:predicted PurR-regulated permease PerM
MIFVGGAVAGVAGLMLVLPVLGVVMVIGETHRCRRFRSAPACAPPHALPAAPAVGHGDLG